MITIGYVGYGFVGKSCEYVFKNNTISLIVDPMYTNTSISEMVRVNPDLIFVSINSPTVEDRSVDAGTVYSIFDKLSELDYSGIVVLKSTLPPNIVEDLSRYSLRYIYSPEFIRAANWQEDALSPKMILMAGKLADCEHLQRLYKQYSCIQNQKFVVATYKEASLIKYSINSFLATKVVFMNQLYQLYADIIDRKPSSEEWNQFINILKLDSRLGETHMQVPGHDNEMGYAGFCFPKDVKAMIGFDTINRLTLIKEVENANTRLRLKNNE